MKIFKTEDIQYFKAPVHVWFVKKKTKDMNGIEKFKKKLLFYLNHPKLLGFF
jgi:hypothetical protein